MNATVEDWRLGAKATPARSSRSRTESLVPGEVLVAYLDQEGNVLDVLRRDAVFAVRHDQIRTDVTSGTVSVRFSVIGRAEGQAFEEAVTWFKAEASAYDRATTAERAAAVSEAGATPRIVLARQLAPLPEPKPAGQPGRRRIDYGDGRHAIVTDGEAKRIEFSDGETVTVTELPEDGAGDVSQKPRPRYAVPSRFSLEIFDKDGMRVTRYGRHRPSDGLPEVL
jgi:hypothetical protein